MTLGHVRMDAPVERSLLDDAADPVVGRPLSRIEGPLKVSGSARYAAEHRYPGLVHGVLAQAPFGAGRISRVDVGGAERMPGVLAVIQEGLARNAGDFAGPKAPSQDLENVVYFRQPVALVVADTFERARAGALAVRVEYEAAAGAFDFDALVGRAVPPDDDLGGAFKIRTEQGDVDAALAGAAATIDAIYETPSQSHAPMEAHGSVAVWEEGRLTVHGSYQSPITTRDQLASSLAIDAADVRVISDFVGGGFGSKLGVMPEAVAAALAARQLGRPVKVVLSRQQVFDVVGRRPETRQRVRLGATRDGRLTAISHETVTSQLDGEIFFEPAGIATHFLYAGENRVVDHKLVRLNKVPAISMRAPGEAVGQLALESAMDELAHDLGIDPVELRLRNEPDRHPEEDIPYSSRSLKQCLVLGAERFGWEERNRLPGGRREGEWLVGHGMAVAARGNLFGKSKAKVEIGGDGKVTVASEMTDIGTGSYTILAQIAADMLGVQMEDVAVRLGDTDDPTSAGSGGSWGATTSGTAVYAACEVLRAKLAAAAGATPADVSFADGCVEAEGVRRPLAELVGNGIEAEGSCEPGQATQGYSQESYGAHFCEVRVNATTGETRVARWTSVFAAGRILNQKTARSQCIGGIVFGIGGALTEDLVHDVRTGKVVNRDLGEYHVAAHADVPEIDVVLLEERDHAANPLLAKGVGELGISGAGAAVANAIFNATGVRVREFPITLDKLLLDLPA
ncbi:xanthine dehydrogenase family protein molybdopterin-binding subunit [Sphingomonas sp. BK580]|uniref:xanthine dehydrogenase family protein molybdopterin-binding subunit n=1 Tax=Sphingomonas sp. BK580 TaxID=2586972 RepID=UPI001614EDE1|nr:xanthine dehydrogenase family protein molybdopterin-binding subunit [Sphingomonas sp. BK580]MBB3693545.1 xanthine dehydrogenase YagR molybdenum-binding subunit [Sphingomonas sp. BK580]